ncbi:MAG: MFS transporter [Alphaproteobacteria bacterium]
MKLFSSLNREQKEAIGLLQIGTFLEYFDLMLYIHMAVLLNELFFPKTDPQTAALLAAFTFCATYVFRPIGALIFGWMGDHLGRKSTIIVTTVMMSISCVIMANLPTYAQIGISAGWIMLICRMVQGMSSMGELIGAEIYIAESIRRPASYLAVACVHIAAGVGGMTALGVATLVTSFLLDWRIAFWIGAAIALVGAVARTRLRETPDFLEMKRKQLGKSIAELQALEIQENPNSASQPNPTAWRDPVKPKTLLSYFLIYCGWPLTFYLGFIYFNTMLKENFGYSGNDIIMHNFLLSVIMVLSITCWAIPSAYIHPIKLIKTRGILAFVLMLLMPFIIMFINSPIELFLLQAGIMIAGLGVVPADAVAVYHLPIARRFTYASFLYALTRTTMYIITSFGLVYLGSYWGHFGLWCITLPITIAYLYGTKHFENLERKIGIYPNLSRATAPSTRQAA